MFTHTLNFKIWNSVCLFSTKFSKTRLQIFSCQNKKSELSIDGLVISVPVLTFGVRKRQKFFVKWVKKCTLGGFFKFRLSNFIFAIYQWINNNTWSFLLNENNLIYPDKLLTGVNPCCQKWYEQNVFGTTEIREVKFKRALRVHFLTNFTKNFCRFLTPKVKSGTDMISPLIESSWFSILA